MFDQTTWAERNPRLSGLAAIALGAVLVSVNLAALDAEGRGWTSLFPLAGTMASAGALQAVVGMRARSFYAAPAWYRIAIGAFGLLGMSAGLAVNWMMFGTLV